MALSKEDVFYSFMEGISVYDWKNKVLFVPKGSFKPGLSDLYGIERFVLKDSISNKELARLLDSYCKETGVDSYPLSNWCIESLPISGEPENDFGTCYYDLLEDDHKGFYLRENLFHYIESCVFKGRHGNDAIQLFENFLLDDMQLVSSLKKLVQDEKICSPSHSR